MQYTIFLIGLDTIVKFRMCETVGEDGKKWWKCLDCSYVSNKTTNLYKHIERRHLTVSLQCPLCGKLFRAREDLQVHKKHFHV